MRQDSHRYLIAYDVPDDKRRGHMAVTLKRFGLRVQFSVFMVDCSPSHVLVLQRELEDIMDRDQDSVLVSDLGLSKTADDRAVTWLGHSRYIVGDGSMII
ncbi:CRISPR-associated endonuclease Cas2 [Acidipropionibacterium virtanenii]|uniref:CRISPR-associated endoribonuclease Cas2 n=1 Tax=Acidipropionibacterium virtanenii TaxID=2057246 RepID=A0A344UQZ7_9ACTN|nr:CRISPR-associated endonuclease Cas2 [Acidipropionibacterium virtanenii]AXE37695.1 CRISPR-associated endonuclease Cas2 2 [Acidipropionibacterium virtanenii]